jgi:hypothetical protein
MTLNVSRSENKESGISVTYKPQPSTETLPKSSKFSLGLIDPSTNMPHFFIA